jgi:hypothetical protein
MTISCHHAAPHANHGELVAGKNGDFHFTAISALMQIS